jgi:hypothetical protein
MIKGFISYAHNDYAAFKEMMVHLRAVERAFDIKFWADKRINPGDYWSTKIADAIEEAQVHVLLCSPAFIYADYIFDHELPAINAKCAKGDLVLPVVIERCAWSWFVGVLQASPTDGNGKLLPIYEWAPPSHGFNAVREQISSSIAAKFGGTPRSPFPWSPR